MKYIQNSVSVVATRCGQVRQEINFLSHSESTLKSTELGSQSISMDFRY